MMTQHVNQHQLAGGHDLEIGYFWRWIAWWFLSIWVRLVFNFAVSRLTFYFRMQALYVHVVMITTLFTFSVIIKLPCLRSLWLLTWIAILRSFDVETFFNYTIVFTEALIWSRFSFEYTSSNAEIRYMWQFAVLFYRNYLLGLLLRIHVHVDPMYVFWEAKNKS